MIEETKTQCSNCEEEINEDEGSHWTLKGETECDSCYESSWEHPSTCYTFGDSEPGDEVEAVHFTADYGDLENQELPTPVAEEVWVATDGWRGHTEWKLKPGFVTVADGWVTGYPDESMPRKQRISDLFERFQNGELIPPVPVWWLFGTTSNVFSTVSDIVCRERDHSTLKEWLEAEGVSILDLEYMLT